MSIPMKDDKVTSQENSDSEWIDVDNDLVNENTGIIQVGSKSEQDSTEQSTTTSSDNSQINLKNDSDEITPKLLNVWIQSSCALQTIALEKGVLTEKAKSFLDIFDEHNRSSNARQFWNNVKSDKGCVKQALLQDNENIHHFDSEIVPISLTNVFRKILEESEKNKDKAIESESVTHLSRAVELEYNNLDETTELGSNNINQETELELKNLDDATKFNDVLEVYQTCVLPDEQLIYNGTNVLDFIYSTNELKKSPLSIGVINLHNVDCTKFLPVDFKKDIAKQLQNPKIKSIKFSNGNIIDKLHVNCDEVLKFLDKFDNVTDLKSLGERLDENMLNVPGNSSPKLDGKGLLRSLGTEILAQEDGVLNTYGKRTGDLKKLEYCTKIILTVLYFALPTTERNEITEIETYSLQSNGFQLIISASKYLFENTIITVDLQDIEVPRTVEGFSKL
ncbi:35211_t:CDS:2, partial [Gigaspora margarita]